MLLVMNLTSLSAAADEKTDLDRAIELGKELQVCLDTKKAEVAACRDRAHLREGGAEKICEARIDGEKKIAAREVAGLKAQLKLTEQALDETEEEAERSWVENPSMWFWGGVTVGIVLGVGMSFGSVWAVSQLTDQPLRPVIE
jgi:hypothetical protein